MRAIFLGERVEVRPEHPTPTPKANEVMVRVLRAGICETDLQLIRGYMGFRGVLGHEFVGVAETGPFAGRRVVGEINCACGHCAMCTRGFPTHCSNRTVLGILNHDGAFADCIAVPQQNLHRVPDSLTTDVAVFTEPVAAAFQIPAQIAINRNDRVVVLGDGRLGNLCAQVLAMYSDRVLAIGKHREKLALLDALGIRTATVDERADAIGADIVVECTGSESGLPMALELVRARGTIVLKTTVAGVQTMQWARFVIDEITLVGSRCGPFDRALAALAAGDVKVQPLISQRFDLAQGIQALERAQAKDVLKVLLDVSES